VSEKELIDKGYIKGEYLGSGVWYWVKK